MVRGRVKVSVRERDWGLMGGVYGWAKIRVGLTKTITQTPTITTPLAEPNITPVPAIEGQMTSC